MATLKNYYKVLELETFADADTIKAAYRRLARKYHPDLNKDNVAAEEKFKRINEAYDYLSDSSRKAIYDQSLKQMSQKKVKKEKATSQKSQSQKSPPPQKKAQTKSPEHPPKPQAEEPASSTPIHELFESFLKKGFGTEESAQHKRQGTKKPKDTKSSGVFKPKSAVKRGEDISVETNITPLEAEQGVIKTVNVQHNEFCRHCSGTGKVSGSSCSTCHGEKIVTRLKKIDVRIPVGVKQGSKVRVSGEGGRGKNGGEDGDLFLNISIAVDPSLRIDGANVYCEVTISITEAVLGAELDVPTLNGPVKMTVPPNTSSGKVFRLKGMGVQHGGVKGDEFVTVNITSPDSLSDREKELFEELAKIQEEKKRK
ncbi:MAG: DnaJ domain-containing protein [Vampirovibrio sp.]|nr:DnaJ domain-containing protein [Vampirovibrio sp.]